jgi:hypothetical protein
LLAAALLAAATFLTATTPFASASLLLALALLAFTLLSISIFLLAATALLSATALFAALLSSAFRFDGFVRVTFCFHGTFLYLVSEFADWSFRTSRLDLFFLSNRLGMKRHNRDDGWLSNQTKSYTFPDDFFDARIATSAFRAAREPNCALASIQMQ